MTIVERPLSVVSVFVWIGFVCAISFMEAWLKFQAPGITLSLGLGIGRLVFFALNKVEWLLAAVVLLNILTVKGSVFSKINIFYFIPLMILAIQTFYMLPFLDQRAEQIINGREVLPSNMHFMYIIAESAKILSLIIFGINNFRKPVSSTQTL